MNAHTTRREIAAKKARVVYLVDLLRTQAPLIPEGIETGFFLQSAQRLRECADYCDEVSRLNGEIVQLTLDLEPRLFQMHLPAAAVPA